MLLNYWEKCRLTRLNQQEQLASMEIGASPAMEVIQPALAETGEALISVYQFSRPSGDPGSLVVCHDTGRGAISFGTKTQWGQWDEAYEILTVDGTGEQYNFDGQPVAEGDDGSCSLGNI
jgi:hypothetical protein